jgi:hypothetical protein
VAVSTIYNLAIRHVTETGKGFQKRKITVVYNYSHHVDIAPESFGCIYVPYTYVTKQNVNTFTLKIQGF